MQIIHLQTNYGTDCFEIQRLEWLITKIEYNIIWKFKYNALNTYLVKRATNCIRAYCKGPAKLPKKVGKLPSQPKIKLQPARQQTYYRVKHEAPDISKDYRINEYD